MLNLLSNEHMKVYRRWRTWIFISVIVGLYVCLNVLSYANNYDSSEDQINGSTEKWRLATEAQISGDREQLNFILNDEANQGINKENLKFFENSIAINEYRLTNDIPPLSYTMWESINNALQFLPLVVIFSVIIAADSVASEFSTGTIKLLLVQPIKRWKILLSKYITVMLFFVVLVFVLMISSIISSGILYQFEGFSVPDVTMSEDGVIQTKNMIVQVAQNFTLQSIELFFIITIAFMISSIFRTSAVAIAFSIGFTFLGPLINFMISDYSWSKYYLFRHTNLSAGNLQMLAADGITLPFTVVLLTVYFVTMVLITWLIFERRDVTA